MAVVDVAGRRSARSAGGRRSPCVTSNSCRFSDSMCSLTISSRFSPQLIGEQPWVDSTLASPGSISMLKSSAGAEWVSAPTEMKSTPVSAIARGPSRGRRPPTPPACTGRRSRSSRSSTASRSSRGLHVVEQEPVGAGARARRRPRRGRGTRPRPRRRGSRRAQRRDRLREAAGQGDVVLLDQDRVVEARRGG